MYTMSLSRTVDNAEEITRSGVYAVFSTLPHASTPQVMSQMDRRDRLVFMLLDGKRTVRDVAQLIHRSELDVARTLVRLLQSGYIIFTGN